MIFCFKICIKIFEKESRIKPTLHNFLHYPLGCAITISLLEYCFDFTTGLSTPVFPGPSSVHSCYRSQILWEMQVRSFSAQFLQQPAQSSTPLTHGPPLLILFCDYILFFSPQHPPCCSLKRPDRLSHLGTVRSSLGKRSPSRYKGDIIGVSGKRMSSSRGFEVMHEYPIHQVHF